MKILKPGKVEQRKFVCRNCGCVFAAHTGDAEFLTTKNSPYVFCPTCSFTQSWHDGEPYEEPTPTQTDGDKYAEALARLKCEYVEELVAFLETNGFKLKAEPKRTDRERMFDLLANSEFWFEDNAAVLKLTDFLIEHGVTFREG